MKIAKHSVGGKVEVFEADAEVARGIEAAYEKPDRRMEYNKRGATIEALVIAMFENDVTEIQRLQAIRESVKLDIPKDQSIKGVIQ